MSTLQKLLEAERFEECAAMAMQILQSDGHTTQEALECHYALLKCHLKARSTIAAAHSGEQALALACDARDFEMAGKILVGLRSAYCRLRMYRQQERADSKVLRMLMEFGGTLELEFQVRFGLATAALKLGEYQRALNQVGMARAVCGDDPGAAEECRRLMRSAMLRLGRLDEVQTLLAESYAYIDHHPDDRKAKFKYWFDLAEYTLAGGSPERAVLNVLQALDFTAAKTVPTVLCYLLLHRCAAARQEWADALAFALHARLAALDGERHDLSHQALLIMSDLLQEHGPVLLDGLGRHFASSGLDPFRFLPTLVGGPEMRCS